MAHVFPSSAALTVTCEPRRWHARPSIPRSRSRNRKISYNSSRKSSTPCETPTFRCAEAVVALGAFIHAAEDVSALKSILPQLLDDFFKLMNEVESEDVVYTLGNHHRALRRGHRALRARHDAKSRRRFLEGCPRVRIQRGRRVRHLGQHRVPTRDVDDSESVSSLPHMYPNSKMPPFRFYKR